MWEDHIQTVCDAIVNAGTYVLGSERMIPIQSKSNSRKISERRDTGHGCGVGILVRVFHKKNARTSE